MNWAERQEILEDEWLIVRNSGELPEITFHSSLYFLTEDKSGPGLVLDENEILSLKHAAVERYQEIILRDILLDNYHKSLYRGIRRAIYNLERLQKFCERQGLEWVYFREIVAEQLVLFLEQGISIAGNDLPRVFLNCTFDQLLIFLEKCEVQKEQLPENIMQFCLQK